jgi:hypothetical protein
MTPLESLSPQEEEMEAMSQGPQIIDLSRWEFMGMNGSGFRVWSGAIGISFYCSGWSDLDCLPRGPAGCWVIGFSMRDA